MDPNSTANLDAPMDWNHSDANKETLDLMAKPLQSPLPPYGGVIKRMTGEKISIPIVIGSFVQALRKPINVHGEDWVLTHKWGCYVRGLRETSSATDPMEEQDLSFMIKKVEFQIHESFPESLITIEKSPFEIHNAGYG